MRLNGYNMEDIELNRNAMYNKGINDCLEIIKFHRESWNGIECAIRDIEELKAENENKR